MVKHNSAIKFCPGFNGSDDVSVGVQPLASIHAAISSRQPGSSFGDLVLADHGHGTHQVCMPIRLLPVGKTSSR